MIRGSVTSSAVATVELIFDDPHGNDVAISVGIDTGLDGDLLLPASLVQSLQLQRLGQRKATLADGSIVTYENYVAIVIWEGVPKLAAALETSGAALMGMNLLQGSRLTIDVAPNGAVTIEPLP